MSKCDTHDVN